MDDIKMGLECPYCSYQWIPRVTAPIECPRCKRHFAENVIPGRVEVNGPEWIRKLPEVKKVVVKSAHRSAYIQCAACLEEDLKRDKDEKRDGTEIREAIIKIGGKSYCEEHADRVYEQMKAEYKKKKPEVNL